MATEASKSLVVVNDAPLAEDIITSLVTEGDLSKLNKKQQFDYYIYRCRELGLDPAEQPFQLLRLNGKLVLYAKKSCTDAMCRNRGVSREIVSSEFTDGVYVVRARATCNGRSDEEIGAVSVKGLTGDALANALMKATTKAKRRAVLALFGVGALDESEIETIPGAQVEPVSGGAPAPVAEPVAVIEIDESVERPRPAEDAGEHKILAWHLGEIARFRRMQGLDSRSSRVELRFLRGGKAWPSGRSTASQDDYTDAIGKAELAIHELKDGLEFIEEGARLMPGPDVNDTDEADDAHQSCGDEPR